MFNIKGENNMLPSQRSSIAMTSIIEAEMRSIKAILKTKPAKCAKKSLKMELSNLKTRLRASRTTN